MSTSNKGFHPVIYEYLKKYQDDPTSRVFAPLAEAYRKAGLIDEAIEIAREGLQVHPHFMGGRVALSRALFDKKLYEEVLEELKPVIQDVPDNLVAQRLVAESCLILGRVSEALDAYKMLLFFQPQDQEVAQLVRELEIQAYQKGALILHSDAELGFDIRPVEGAVAAAPHEKKTRKVKKIEKLQSFLQRIEKHRTLNEFLEES